MTTTLRGTKAIWDRIDPAYRRILDHPFLTGVRDGTLDHAAFGRYIVQDALYLREYARSLALCAARGADSPMVEMFCAHSASARIGTWSPRPKSRRATSGCSLGLGIPR